MKETSAALEEETRSQAAIRARLREENQRLQEQADSQARRQQKDQDAQAELQAKLKKMTTAHAQVAQRLAEEESARKELQKGASELQAKLTALQEERAALSQQLELERDVHQKELDNMKATMEDSRLKKDREVQNMLKLCRQERDEMQTHLREVKVGPFIKVSEQLLNSTKTRNNSSVDFVRLHWLVVICKFRESRD